MTFRGVNGRMLEDPCHDSSFSFIRNHPVNATVLTYYNVERGQQYMWRLLAWEDQATSISNLNYPVQQYLRPFMLKGGIGRWCELCTWEGHIMTRQFPCWIIREMQQYLHSIMLSGVCKTVDQFLHMTFAMTGTSCFKSPCWCNGTYVLWYWKEAIDVTGFVHETVMPRHSPFQTIL
jgi:hypothetical protein